MPKETFFRANTLFYLVSALFFLVSNFVIRFNYHELWKDEWQSWFVARDMDIVEMLKFLYYEGHPALWYLYLKPFTWFSHFVADDLLINSAHFIAYGILVGIILSFNNISGLTKWLFLLGYYPLFEYGMIARGYILVMILFFLLVKYLPKASTHPHLLGIIFLVLCQTELYGVIAAAAWLFYIFLEQRGVWSSPIQFLRLHRHYWIIASYFLAGVVLFYVTINWAPDAGEIRARLVNIMSAYKGKSGFQAAFQGFLGHAFLPGILPAATKKGISGEGLFLAVAGIASILFIFRQHKHQLLAIVFYIFWVVYFAATTYSGGMRQWGMLYVFVMAMIFLQFSQQKTSQKWTQMLVYILLILHIIYGVRAVWDEIRYPFTNAKKTAHYMTSSLNPNIPVVGISPFNVAAPSGYSGITFYELPDGVPFTYFRWLEKVYMPPQDELALFAQYKKSKGLYVISHKPLDLTRYPQLKLIQSISEFNIKDENFYIYGLELQPGDLGL
jgi:hypothetical protein